MTINIDGQEEDIELGELAAELAIEILKKGNAFRYTAEGNSMRPFIHDRDQLTISPLSTPPKLGEVVLCHVAPFGFVHRVIDLDDKKGVRLQGDNLSQPDGWFDRALIVGKVTAIVRNGRSVPVLEAPMMVILSAQLRMIRKTRGGAFLLRGAGQMRRLRIALLESIGR